MVISRSNIVGCLMSVACLVLAADSEDDTPPRSDAAFTLWNPAEGGVRAASGWGSLDRASRRMAQNVSDLVSGDTSNLSFSQGIGASLGFTPNPGVGRTDGVGSQTFAYADNIPTTQSSSSSSGSKQVPGVTPKPDGLDDEASYFYLPGGYSLGYLPAFQPMNWAGVGASSSLVAAPEPSSAEYGGVALIGLGVFGRRAFRPTAKSSPC